MSFNVLKILGLLSASIGAHLSAFYFVPVDASGALSAKTIEEAPLEIEAREAFEELDAMRLFTQNIEKVEAELSEAIVDLPTPNIEIPKVEVAPQKVQQKSTVGKAQKKSQSTTPVKEATKAPVKKVMNKDAANAKFNSLVGKAVNAQFEAPKNVRSAKCQLKLRFIEGRLNGISGNCDAAIKPAAVGAAKSARYPKKIEGMSADLVVVIPLLIKG